MNDTTNDVEGGPADLHADRTVVVAGGTGSVGRVLVDAFLRSGARVVVPSRSDEKLDRLRTWIGDGGGDEAADRLVTLEGDIGDEEEAPRLVEGIADRHGPIHAAVATLGRFVAAPSLFEATLDDLETVIDGYLVGHFVAARALIPALKPGGSYTLVNGPLAFRPMFPRAGLVSTVTAAQAMLARVLMEQADRVRVNEVVLYTRFGWDDDEDEGSAPVTREQVGRYVSHLASARGKDVRGQSLHLDSRDVLRELVHAR